MKRLKLIAAIFATAAVSTPALSAQVCSNGSCANLSNQTYTTSYQGYTSTAPVYANSSSSIPMSNQQVVGGVAAGVVTVNTGMPLVESPQQVGNYMNSVQPVYAQPAFSQQAYSQPAYSQPGYPQPAYSQTMAANGYTSTSYPTSMPQQITNGCCQQPMYGQQTYSQPRHCQPSYPQPAYPQPAYSQPACAQPVYSQPVYSQQVQYRSPQAGCCQSGQYQTVGSVSYAAPVVPQYQRNVQRQTMVVTNNGSYATTRGNYVSTSRVGGGLAQRKAQQAANGRIKGHVGGGLGNARYEGVGWSTVSADSAVQACCYWGTRPVAEVGVVRGNDGWYACVLYN